MEGNRAFGIFWAGQSLSNLGDAFAMLAIPLLVLQATGSVAQMGLVTGTFGVAQLLTGVVAGALVDRLDRRRLMIACDLGRTALYAAIPLGWWTIGPQIWLIYAVTALGSCLGMCFQVAYITAVPNLVERERISDANGRLQATQGLAFVAGPALAGLVSGSFGPAAAIGIDAATFLISALSLALIRLRRTAPPAQGRGSPLQELLAGARYLFQQPVLRAITPLFAAVTLLTAAGMDLFIFHIKHDLQQGDRAVGLVLGVASVGGVLGGLLAPAIRRRWGFGVCWLGSLGLIGLMMAGIGLAPSVAVIVPLTLGVTFATVMMGVVSMSLRQEITPDHLLGRVTAAFWTLSMVPGPLGAAMATALAARTGAPAMLALMGLGALIVALIGLATPVRLRHPETASA